MIASGHERHPLGRILAGAPCTWFVPSRTPLAARKQWIAGTLTPRGRLVVDDGAVAAIRRGNSLLAIGIKAIEGNFERGDAVVVVTADGRDIGRGLAAHGSADARKMMGRRSSEIEQTLGFAARSEIVHRDNLVLLDSQA